MGVTEGQTNGHDGQTDSKVEEKSVPGGPVGPVSYAEVAAQPPSEHPSNPGEHAQGQLANGKAAEVKISSADDNPTNGIKPPAGVSYAKVAAGKTQANGKAALKVKTSSRANGPPGDIRRRTAPKNQSGGPAHRQTQGDDDEDQAQASTRIRFAPIRVPLKRRLQTLTVLVHCMCLLVAVPFFFFICAIPLAWPLLVPYLLHVIFSTAATDGSLTYRSKRFRSSRIWKLFAEYFPAKLHKTHDLPPTRKYIFGYHPHGIISHGAFVAFATEALGFSEKFPGITNSLLTLDSNFNIPIYREYILAAGIRSVSKESITNHLTRGGKNKEGMGRAVTIVIGGARESLEARPGVLRLILRDRMGFVRMAMRTGADLVPVLAFGENDLYNQLEPENHPLIHRLQMFVLKAWKFTLPFMHGRGIFNYDYGLMPFRKPLNIVVGKPIPVVASSNDIVNPAEVERVHALYCDELQRLWDEYKDRFAKDRKGEMELLV